MRWFRLEFADVHIECDTAWKRNAISWTSSTFPSLHTAKVCIFIYKPKAWRLLLRSVAFKLTKAHYNISEDVFYLWRAIEVQLVLVLIIHCVGISCETYLVSMCSFLMPKPAFVFLYSIRLNIVYKYKRVLIKSADIINGVFLKPLNYNIHMYKRIPSQ